MCDHGLHPDLPINHVLREWPATRRVFHRHGLGGCGGPGGPAESLRFFARAHHVDLDELMDQLGQVLAAPPDPTMEESASGEALPPQELWRWFFRAGILVTLTAGATWGAWLLARIAFAGTFTGPVRVAEINAHGFAQIFGWLGLFVMGFAYQAFPRFRRTELAHPRWASGTLPLMVAGILGRAVSEPLADRSPFFLALGLTSSLLVVAAVCLFAWIVVATFRSGRTASHPGDPFLLSAVFWFVVSALGELGHFAATATAGVPGDLLAHVADWQVPLRDVQFHGFALLMVVGVGLRLLPGFFDVPSVRRSTCRWVLFALNAGVTAEVVGYVLLRRGHGSGVLFMQCGWLALLAGCLALAPRLGGWTRASEWHRSLKFVRAAWIWLLVSLGLLVSTPVWLQVTEQGFSHAWFGATRHAITVGFFSMMILGVSSRVVPMLRGLESHGLSPLVAPFLLLNLGCGLRVVFQILTDLDVRAFPVMGISGLLEVSALLSWAVPLWREMSRKAPEMVPEPALRGITGEESVASILASRGGARELLIRRGFTPLASPALRATLARTVTLRAACRLNGVELSPLVEELNRLPSSSRTAAGHPCRATDPTPSRLTILSGRRGSGDRQEQA